MNKYIPTIVLKLPQVVEALYLDVCDKQSRILKKISMQRKIRKKISKVFCIFARLRTHLGHPRVNLLDCLSSVVLIFFLLFLLFLVAGLLGAKLESSPKGDLAGSP
jgi:dolichol kinase